MTNLPRLKRFAREHWLMILLAVSIPVMLALNERVVALICAISVLLSASADWVGSRAALHLDQSTRAELRDALRSLPAQRWLVDRERDDLLWMNRRNLLGRPAWTVLRIPNAPQMVQEVEDDIRAGQLSTQAYLLYRVAAEIITVHHVVEPVRAGADGAPEPFDLPGRTSPWKGMWLRVRTRSTRPTSRDVAELLAQLRRVEPLPGDPGEDHTNA